MLALAATAAAAPAVADYRDGWNAFQAAEYDATIREWLPLAERGDPRAQYGLAILLLYGRGTERDSAAAAALMAPAAASGHAEAAFALALLYQDGKGVGREFVEAAWLYRIAAETGYGPAQNNRAIMLAIGQGIDRDPIAAHAWFSLAAAVGEPGAARNRDRLAAELSPADLVLSDRRAAAWTTARRGTGLANPGATYPGVQEVLGKLARVAAAPPPAPMAEPAARVHGRCFRAGADGRGPGSGDPGRGAGATPAAPSCASDDRVAPGRATLAAGADAPLIARRH